MLKINVVPVTAFQQNCSISWCEKTMKAVVTDPGGDVEQILRAIKETGVDVERILLTHAHIDHAGGAAQLAQALNIPIEGPHEEDRFLIESLAEQGQNFGLPGAAAFEPSKWLNDGDTIQFGEERFDVIHTPGHTPGHVVFYNAASQVALVGDVIFAGSIGRTDFPRGDYDTLIASIRNKLFPLGDDTVFLPGHGPSSTFGREKADNPFVGEAARFR